MAKETKTASGAKVVQKGDDIEIVIEIDADVKGMQKQLDRLVRDSYNARSSDIQKDTVRGALKGFRDDEEDEEEEQLQWVAILDGDTCPECEDLDGEIISVDDPDAPPLHPNCRCVLSPVIDEASLLDIIRNLVGI